MALFVYLIVNRRLKLSHVVSTCAYQVMGCLMFTWASLSGEVAKPTGRQNRRLRTHPLCEYLVLLFGVVNILHVSQSVWPGTTCDPHSLLFAYNNIVFLHGQRCHHWRQWWVSASHYFFKLIPPPPSSFLGYYKIVDYNIKLKFIYLFVFWSAKI